MHEQLLISENKYVRIHCKIFYLVVNQLLRSMIIKHVLYTGTKNRPFKTLDKK